MLKRLFRFAGELEQTLRRRFRLGLVRPARIFLVVLLCALGGEANAAISSVTVTASVPQQPSDFSDLPITFQKFDSTLGQLASVEIILQGNGEMTQEFENTTTTTHNSARIRQTVDFSLTLPNVTKPFLSVSQTEKHKYSAGPFDGTVDFGGTSGTTATYDITASGDKIFQSGKNLANFSGTDLGEMFLSSDSPFHISSRQSAVVGAAITEGADITIIYSYTAIPEPVWYGVLAGSAGLIGSVCFLMQKRRV